MECPQCKNPLSVENASICEWCGNQLPIPEESFFAKFKRLYSNFIDKLITNKKRLFIIFSSILIILLFLILRNNWKHWFTDKEPIKNEITESIDNVIVPKGLKQTRAFEYLTKVRKELVENSENFENIAIKYSQDSLLSSCKGIEVDNGQLPPEFDEMASKLEVNKVSEIFEIKDSTGEPIKYVIMKLLYKGNGFYKAQYITRNIKLEIGQYYQGGIIFHLDNNAEHGLIAAKKDLGEFLWVGAKQKCEELKLNGYDDWYIPSKDELNLIFERKDKIGGFVSRRRYWDITSVSHPSHWPDYWCAGDSDDYNAKGHTYYVRPIRAF